MSACFMRSTTVAHSSRSPREVGKKTPRLAAPTPWPARPMRCRALATDPGACAWITRSTAPMSMPSSSEEVATTQGSRPAFSSDSISRRRCLLTDPWCARAMIATSDDSSYPGLALERAVPPAGMSNCA